MLNCAGKTICKLICFNNAYHVIIQSFTGVIHHEKFNSEDEARVFIHEFNTVKVITEYLR